MTFLAHTANKTDRAAMSLNVDPNTFLSQHRAAMSHNEDSNGWMETSSSSPSPAADPVESPDPLLIHLTFRIFNELPVSKIIEEDTNSKRLESTIIIRSFPSPTLRELKIEIRDMIKIKKGFNMKNRLQEGDLGHHIPLARMKLTVRWESTRGDMPDLEIETDGELTEALGMMQARAWRDVFGARVDIVRRLPALAGNVEDVTEAKEGSIGIGDKAKEEGDVDQDVVVDRDEDEEISDEEEKDEKNESCKQQSGQVDTSGDGKTGKAKKMKLPETRDDREQDGSFEVPNFEPDFVKLKPKRKKGSKDVDVISLSSDDEPKKKKRDKKDKSGSRRIVEHGVGR